MKKSIVEVVHESAKRLHDSGLMDAETMQSFDAMLQSTVQKAPASQTCCLQEEIKQWDKEFINDGLENI